MSDTNTQDIADLLSKIVDTKTDSDFIKQQIMNQGKNLEVSFQNIAQGHNELYRMITIITHALLKKGLVTQEELVEVGKELAEESARNAEARQHKDEANPASTSKPTGLGLVTADGQEL